MANPDAVILGPRFEHALVYATQLHREQRRKGSETPYITHLMAVAALVGEHGGSEDEIIAALLHDAVEDQGGRVVLATIRALWGDDVAAIVEACSDTDQTPKPPWLRRKQNYIAHIAHLTPSALLVSAADKLHNARAILADLRTQGDALWSRFNAPKDSQLWYYAALVDAFRGRCTALQQSGVSRVASDLAPLVDELERVVDALLHACGAEAPSGPPP
jgi:GTP pyrophosphokinase